MNNKNFNNISDDNYVYVLKSTISMYEEPTIDGIFDNKADLVKVMKELNIKKRDGVEESEPEEFYYTSEEVNFDWANDIQETYYFVFKIPKNYHAWFLDNDFNSLTDVLDRE